MKFKNRIMKWNKLLFSMLLLFMSSLSVPTYAKEQDEIEIPIPVIEEQLGSITIQLTDTKDALSKENVEFGITKVADWNTNGDFINSATVTEANLDVNSIENAIDLEDMASKLQKLVKPELTEKTDKNGTAIFKDLNVGLYLVKVTNYAEYENVTPFLVSVPMFDEVDKVMNYDVTVLPKHEAFPIIFINKVDSITNKNITNKDFEFTLFSDEECKNIIWTKAGNTETGTAAFQLKDEGIYYLKETKAPKGYLLSNEVVKVEFSGRGLLINDKASKHDEDNVYSIVYQNALMPIINTGVSTSVFGLVTMFVGALAVLVGSSYIRAKKAK